VDDAPLGLLDNRYPDRAHLGSGPDIHERWGSGMTEHEEIVRQMAVAIRKQKFARTGRIGCFDETNITDDELSEARAALAVAEPVIREWCAANAAAIAKEHLTDAVARLVAAAIREGGKDDI